MRTHYEYQLGQVCNDLVHLGTMVEAAVQHAVNGLKTWDAFTARQVILNDSQIDTIQVAIEEAVFTLIALQQPVARDLRLLTTMLAIAAELERIGDYACGIARSILRTPTPPPLLPPTELYTMAADALTMLHTSMEAFRLQNAGLTEQLSQDDERVDALEDALNAELIKYAQSEPQKMEAVIDMLTVVHTLERIADRATNIGERVIYLATSTVVALNP